MEKKLLPSKILILIFALIFIIFFTCIYSLTMIHKAQSYVQETGKNWMPSVQAFSRMNLYIGNLSRRNVLIISDAIVNQNENLPKNLEDITKFRMQLEKEIKNYSQLISPNEQQFYDDLIIKYHKFLKALDTEINLTVQNKPLESLKHYNEIGRPTLFQFTDVITKEMEFNSKGGMESIKKSNYLTSITNWMMIFLIAFSILISLFIINHIFKTNFFAKRKDNI